MSGSRKRERRDGEDDDVTIVLESIDLVLRLADADQRVELEALRERVLTRTAPAPGD